MLRDLVALWLLMTQLWSHWYVLETLVIENIAHTIMGIQYIYNIYIMGIIEATLRTFYRLYNPHSLRNF